MPKQAIETSEPGMHLAVTWADGDHAGGIAIRLGGEACALPAASVDELIMHLQRARRDAYGVPPPAASVIEIVEPGRTTDGTIGGSIIIPRDVRVNGVSVLTSGGVTVHGMVLPGNGEPATVTLTLLARMLTIAAEGDLAG